MKSGIKAKRSLQETDARRRVLRAMLEQWGLAIAVGVGAGAMVVLFVVVVPVVAISVAGLMAGVVLALDAYGWPAAVLLAVLCVGAFVVTSYRDRLRDAGVLPTRCPHCGTKPCRNRCQEVLGLTRAQLDRRSARRMP
jgi:hypothetical protein